MGFERRFLEIHCTQMTGVMCHNCVLEMEVERKRVCRLSVKKLLFRELFLEPDNHRTEQLFLAELLFWSRITIEPSKHKILKFWNRITIEPSKHSNLNPG